MSATNLGNQLLTFDYKQAGTSKGFDKIFYNTIPRGIIRGGELSKVNNTSINISPCLILFEDTTEKVSIRLETQDTVNVNVNNTNPWIIGEFSWLDVEDNYMEFKSVSSINDLSDAIIFGKCIFNGNELVGFDSCRKSWSKDHYENTLSYKPNFLVYPKEPNSTKVIVDVGSAIIGGKKVVIESPIESGDIDVNVTNGRIDLLVLNSSGTIEIIKGTDTSNPTAPTFPMNKLPLAFITLPPNPQTIKGNMIEYIYTNHFTQENISEGGNFNSPILVTPKFSDGISTSNYLPISMGGTGTNTVNHAKNDNTYGLGSATLYGHLKLTDSLSSTSGVNDGVAVTPNAVNSLNESKAPNNHASSDNTYGVGNNTNYGHLKLSDSVSSNSSTSSGYASTPSAVKRAYDLANSANTLATEVNTTLGGFMSAHFSYSNGNLYITL